MTYGRDNRPPGGGSKDCLFMWDGANRTYPTVSKIGVFYRGTRPIYGRKNVGRIRSK